MNPDREEQALVDVIPPHVSFGTMLKATPVTEGDSRFIYLEASNEARDLQNEIVLAKALEESADYYLKFGNLDLEHYTQIGAKQGIPNHESYEIGRPVEARFKDGRTFVKGCVYSGSGPAADKANLFWSSLTELNPPQRWYPSVGGVVMAKGVKFDPATNQKVGVVTKVRWANIGFSKTPVNPELETVSIIPFGALAKCWGADGLDLSKALLAEGGSDVANLTGGAALRLQSLDHSVASTDLGEMSYADFRDRFAQAIQHGDIQADLQTMQTVSLQRFGLTQAQATLYVERFLDELHDAFHGIKNPSERKQ